MFPAATSLVFGSGPWKAHWTEWAQAHVFLRKKHGHQNQLTTIVHIIIMRKRLYCEVTAAYFHQASTHGLNRTQCFHPTTSDKTTCLSIPVSEVCAFEGALCWLILSLALDHGWLRKLCHQHSNDLSKGKKMLRFTHVPQPVLNHRHHLITHLFLKMPFIPISLLAPSSTL